MSSYNYNIIGIGGRMGSGKFILASVCKKHGYKILSFAIPLKELCCKILNVSLETLTSMKNNNQPINLPADEEFCNTIAKETGLPYVKICEICGKNRTIGNVRELLQFVGTDIIRTLDENWHIKKVTEMMSDGGKYVIDDIRFRNELGALVGMGAACWFIVRPTIIRLSHHVSEETLKWHMFGNKVIVNDGTLESLEERWDKFMTDYANNLELRDKIFDKCQTNDELLISKDIFTYKPKGLDKSRVEDITITNDGAMVITYFDDPPEIIKNALTIEDLKIYL